MRFVVPIHDAHEIGPLARAGASELYCGLAEPRWTNLYGDHDSISRRQGEANFTSRKDLVHAIDTAKVYGIPVYLTLNGRYTEAQHDYLVNLCRDFYLMGGRGVQIYDLGLLSKLNRAKIGLNLCLSLLAVASNAATVHFYARRFGVNRVVFPRFMDPADAKAVLDAESNMRDGVTNIEAEVMIAGDRCPFIDGYCRFYHGNSYRTATGDAAQEAAQYEPMSTYDTTYKTHSCREMLAAPPNEYPCAACDMGAFEAAGVRYAKIGGRGTPLEYRLGILDFLKKATRLPNDEERAKLYEQTFVSPCNCYRPTVDPFEEQVPTRGGVL